MGRQKAVIVGAGVGGLVAAVELARQGLDVTIMERGDVAGGKMRREDIGGAALDAGPTVFTMRWILDEIFSNAGARLDDAVELKPLDTLARHYWPGGAMLDLYADMDRSADAIGQFAGAKEARGYVNFCRDAQRIYETLEHTFIHASQTSLPGLMGRAGVAGLPALARIQPFATLWGELGRYFQDVRLRQLFGRYATYCGSSPFKAPGTLMLVAHVERKGVWLVGGGMHKLAAALVRLAQAQGAELRSGCHVTRVITTGGRVSGVELLSGERVDADVVIWNGDVAALADTKAGPLNGSPIRVSRHAERSLSAMTWATIATSGQTPLHRHNVFFSSDYSAEFDDIHKHGRIPRNPTVYVCAQDRDNAGDTHTNGGNGERLLCLINAPARGDTQSIESWEIGQCEKRTLAHLGACGLNIKFRPDLTLTRTPTHFEQLYPATGGALYGAASHGWRASFQRLGAKTSHRGLYLTGGSVHPGAGVPMAAMSGRLAAQAVMADLISAR